jgi:hypothetical protein
MFRNIPDVQSKRKRTLTFKAMELKESTKKAKHTTIQTRSSSPDTNQGSLQNGGEDMNASAGDDDGDGDGEDDGMINMATTTKGTENVDGGQKIVGEKGNIAGVTSNRNVAKKSQNMRRGGSAGGKTKGRVINLDPSDEEDVDVTMVSDDGSQEEPEEDDEAQLSKNNNFVRIIWTYF